MGIPTYAKDLALRLMEIISYANGIYHITNSGIASRFDYASLVLALTTKGSIQISNISKKEVERPKRVILVNNLDKDLRNWEEALEAYLSSEYI